MSIVMLVFIVFAGAHRSVKDILKCSRIVFEGAISRDQSDKKIPTNGGSAGKFSTRISAKALPPHKEKPKRRWIFSPGVFLTRPYSESPLQQQ